ncbi:glycosyl hydrolase [Arthrobacter echini]|uniref:Glycosyl hydrolase n=1 Tax=Arthrobacter echini TaxID=1529066 RepID=A0A4S5E322_9MICC|nr:glycoside hydrolase family 3 protein [Arthrobacter echini]THJ65831.1 glycosyl hydrolase [Arthrobacter echini]
MRYFGNRYAAVVGAAVLSVGLVGGSMSAALAAPGALISPVRQSDPSDQPWMDSELTPQERADELLSAMTLDQKIQQMQNLPEENDIEGTYLAEGGEQAECGFTRIGRHIEGIESLGIPTMREVNQGTGIRGGDCSPEPIKTGGPSAPLNAASFDTTAVEGWGAVLGAEAKSFAHPVLLGPGLNLLRNPFAGRAQEYPSEDPFLAGTIQSAQIRGTQSEGTQAMMKHYALNDNEYDVERWTSAVHVPARAMHELYLLPFEMAVKDAEVAAVMCSFPMVNGRWACGNETLLRQTLDTWGFTGWIEADRRAMHNTLNSLNAGVGWELDFEPIYYTADALKEHIREGHIVPADIDRVLRPRYVQMFTFGNFDDPLDSFGEDDLEAHRDTARTLAEGGVVLLQNTEDTLPLGGSVESGDIGSVALIGPDWFAGQASMPPRNGSPSELVMTATQETVTPEEGIRNELERLGSEATVTYNDGADIASAVELAEESDLVIMMLGTTPRESQDLETFALSEVNGVQQLELLNAVADANANNVVVLKTGTSVLTDWSDKTRAIVAAWFPGQDDGDVVAGILFGRLNPSGKSPVTWPTSEREAAWETERQYPGIRQETGTCGGQGVPSGFGVGDDADADAQECPPQLVTYYEEDLAMGYRWYEKNDVEPAFAFGHGLSYTDFEYDQLRVDQIEHPSPDQTVMTVQYRVTNTGDVAGAEASQVYLTLPEEAQEPSKRLVGFSKDVLEPGESRDVSVVLDSNASNHPFSYFKSESDQLQEWDEGDWKQAEGDYTVHVGGASNSVPLTETVNFTCEQQDATGTCIALAGGAAASNADGDSSSDDSSEAASSNDGALSAGAITAIVVGGLLLLAAIVALIIWLPRRSTNRVG